MGIHIEYTDQVYWDGLDVTIYFKKNLSDEDANNLNDVFENWHTMATNNEFQGKIHYISNFWIEENQAGFSADMGSTNEESINTLILLLERYSKHRSVKIKKIVIGSEIIE